MHYVFTDKEAKAGAIPHSIVVNRIITALGGMHRADMALVQWAAILTDEEMQAALAILKASR